MNAEKALTSPYSCSRSDEEARRTALIANLNISSSSSQNYSSGITTVPDLDRHYYVAVYGGLVLVALSLSMARALFFFAVAVNSSKNLHNRMFNAILRTRIYFFDTNPIGMCLTLEHLPLFYIRNQGRITADLDPPVQIRSRYGPPVQIRLRIWTPFADLDPLRNVSIW